MSPSKFATFSVAAVLCCVALPGSALASNWEDIYQPWDSGSSGQPKVHPKRHSSKPKVDYGDYSPAVTANPRLRISVVAIAHKHAAAHAGSHLTPAKSPSDPAVIATARASLVGTTDSGSNWPGMAFVLLGVVAAGFVLRPRRR